MATLGHPTLSEEEVLWDSRTALYMLYDCDGTLLYVGITADLATRILTHRRDQEWAHRIDESRTVVRWFPDRPSAALAEASAVRTMEPRFNVEWAPRPIPRDVQLPKGEVSGYRELADVLRTQIRDGVFAPDRRLPTERDLRLLYGLSRWTVRQAIAVLRTEGAVRIVRGWGTVVAEPLTMEDVTVPPGSTVTARMPTVEERAEHGIPEGVPIFVIAEEDGPGDLYPADRFRLRISD